MCTVTTPVLLFLYVGVNLTLLFIPLDYAQVLNVQDTLSVLSHRIVSNTSTAWFIPSEFSIIKFNTTVRITSLVSYQAYQDHPTYPRVHPGIMLRVSSTSDFYRFSNGVLHDSIYSLISISSHPGYLSSNTSYLVATVSLPTCGQLAVAADGEKSTSSEGTQ